jgi:hypothetical protein
MLLWIIAYDEEVNLGPLLDSIVSWRTIADIIAVGSGCISSPGLPRK